MDLGAKYVSFKKGIDFVIEDATKDLGDREALISNMEIANSYMYNRPQGHCEHKIALTLFYLTINPKEINYVKKRINQSKGKNGN